MNDTQKQNLKWLIYFGGEAGRGTAGSASGETEEEKRDKCRRGLLFNHFALKMEAVMISETSAVHSPFAWCHLQKQDSFYLFILSYSLNNVKLYTTENGCRGLENGDQST
jgi:hypothetical protein